ncbi:MAG: hypothetical protein U5M51_08120 [Emticicia sp.]|nr:hypothetical protein [Emticicia sp.]
MEKVNHYSVSEVIDRFEINKIFDCAILKNWVNTPIGTLKPAYSEILEEARLNLERKWDEWNEEELKMNFVSLVIFSAQIEVPKLVNTYYERKFSGKVRDIPISVIVDCMIASPTFSGRPKSPYFFMQEFKRSLGDSHDPEGQMLAAMILAQETNQDGKPIFGSWIQGRFWYFTILNNKDYCVSKPFDATDPKAFLQIIFILRKLKDLILNR